MPVVLPTGAPDAGPADTLSPALPVAPEPVVDGGDDRLVVVTPAAAAARPSATLLAAQQLSDEAGRFSPERRRTGTLVADRRRRVLRAVVDQRRADRTRATGTTTTGITTTG